ncbi:hypothetical protein [Brevibacterium moorei]|uniref:hypothetical protein n=1 Tax=Brevibacterium moorei TaxID=2968457 RepID=UPI00211C1660|nr:hypothetical protein [Brevibacterium sp. 68QC2CO]MCQ9385104.1 hypothetical protein [Brevibacterium sp. 68QC2CO]
MAIGPYSYILWYLKPEELEWINGMFEDRGYDLTFFDANDWSDGDIEIITKGEGLPMIVMGEERGLGGFRKKRFPIRKKADVMEVITLLDEVDVWASTDGIRELMEERPLGNDAINAKRTSVGEWMSESNYGVNHSDNR